jgi:Na+-driven multidrug efflux pump
MSKLARDYIALAIPTVLSALVYTTYSIIDGVFIGRYVGADGLAALNLAVPLLYVPYAISMMVGVGAATLIARMLGEQRPLDAQRVFSWAILALLGLGLAFTAVLLLALPVLPGLLGAPQSLRPLFNEFLLHYAPFAVFASALYAFELTLRAEGAGAARFGLLAMCVGAVANVALDYLFMANWGWGMRGAALATGIAMMASSMTMLAYHFVFARQVRPLWRGMKQMRCLGLMLYNGSSEFLAAVAPAVVVIAFNRVIAQHLGEAGLAAYAVLEYITLAASVVMIALVQSMQPLVSFHRGAGNFATMRHALRLATGAVGAMALAAAAATIFLAETLTFVFLPQGGATWAILQNAVIWYGLAFIPAGLNLLAAGYLTAIERPIPSAVIAVLRSWVLLLATLWTLTALMGAPGIWYAFLTTEVLTIVVSAVLMWRVIQPATEARCELSTR